MSDFNMKQVAQRVEGLRRAVNMDKGEFADSIEIDRSSYSKIIAGDKPLKADMAFRIAEKWGVSMDYLYRGLVKDLPADLAAKLRLT